MRGMRSFLKLARKIAKLSDPEELRVVLRNVASLSVLQAITYVLPVIILPYLFRVIGPEKFGLIAFAQAFAQYFTILTDYGFGVSATKEISLAHEEHARVCEIFSSVMTVKAALAFLSLLLMGLFLYFVPRFRADWMVYLLSFGAVIGNTLFPVWFFQGTEKMKHIADLNIIGGFLILILIFLFVRAEQDYLRVPLITSSVFLLTGLWAQYIVFKKFGVAFKFPGTKNIRQQLRAGWDIFISFVAINAYTTTRIFTVGLLTNNTLTGYYAIAEKIANACQTFPLMSFSQAIFPRLSKIFHKNKDKAYELMQNIQHFTISISLVCLPVIFILSPWIIRAFCGGDYPEAVLSLRLLLVSVFFVSANAFRVQFLLVCGRTETYSRIHVFVAMAGLPMIFLLVYSFNYMGAAIASVAIEAGIFAITYFTVKNIALRSL